MGLPEWYVDDLLGFYAFYSTGLGGTVGDAVTRLTGRQGRRFRQFAEDYQTVFAGAHVRRPAPVSDFRYMVDSCC